MKKRRLRVLVACEFSGVVRSAFEKRGWDALSVDLLPTDIPGNHIEADIIHFLTIGQSFDLMIAHPTCTYLCNSGAKHLYKGMKKENGKDPSRWKKMRHAAWLFKYLLEYPVIPHIAVENPVMMGHAQKLVGHKPAFSLQPWQHGHGEIKRSCFWTKNLPPLIPTNIVDGRQPRVHFMPPGPDRWKERSRTLPGIAKAMADTWGSYIENLHK